MMGPIATAHDIIDHFRGGTLPSTLQGDLDLPAFGAVLYQHGAEPEALTVKNRTLVTVMWCEIYTRKGGVFPDESGDPGIIGARQLLPLILPRYANESHEDAVSMGLWRIADALSTAQDNGTNPLAYIHQSEIEVIPEPLLVSSYNEHLVMGRSGLAPGKGTVSTIGILTDVDPDATWTIDDDGALALPALLKHVVGYD